MSWCITVVLRILPYSVQIVPLPFIMCPRSFACENVIRQAVITRGADARLTIHARAMSISMFLKRGKKRTRVLSETIDLSAKQRKWTAALTWLSPSRYRGQYKPNEENNPGQRSDSQHPFIRYTHDTANQISAKAERPHMSLFRLNPGKPYLTQISVVILCMTI